MAINAQAKIVPVIIYGTKECLGYGKWRIHPGRVVVRLLEAIPTIGMKFEDRDELVNQLFTLAEREIVVRSSKIA